MTNLSKPVQSPRVTVIIPNWNGMRWLPQCFIHLKKQTCQSFQIVVVDNASSDGSVKWILNKYPEVHLIKLKENLGFAHAVNMGIQASETPYVALLNTDTRVHSDWLKHLLRHMQNGDENLGAVSPLMLSMEDAAVIDDAGNSFSWYGMATKIGHGKRMDSTPIDIDIFSPSGGASLYRRSFFDHCGAFDAAFFAYLEDVDLGLRGRLFGYIYELETQAQVYHFGHGSEINRDRYIQLITQNRLLIFLKNIPTRLLIRNLGKIIYGQIYFLIANGRLLPVMKGYLSFLKRIPHIIRKRRECRPKIKLNNGEIEKLLLTEKPGSISYHLQKLWKRKSPENL
ncbi:MAG: glycosyltransferase family 2 protein [Saprospiraceae bacterium]|nr:glycosyltransferase family 2 protein [Saprospiraceae bacterium]